VVGTTMDFLELAAKRYSVRAYKPDPVEDEKLQKVLEAARLAPTAANRQPFQLIVVHTSGRQTELSQIYPRPWFTQAPLIICACAITTNGWSRSSDGVNYSVVDIAIAFDHLTLAATDLGLGTCWVAAFNVEAARKVFGIPPEVDPVVLTPLGYPADAPRSKLRKPLAELVRFEKW
jgi:nitroreductase